MMNKSRRAKRMERAHQRRKQPALNLVSLMDIFTILVFFLLVSSSNVQQLPSSKDIRLPTSVAKKAPKETIVIAVTGKDILVQGRKVATLKQIMANPDVLIPSLKEELLFQSGKGVLSVGDNDNKKGRAVTIMGDENMPYELLRKILTTCRHANYTHIAFAAVQKAKGNA